MPQEYATEERKPSRLRRIFGGIGRVVGNPKFLGALQTGAGALSAQYGGSRIPLQLAMEREENEREDMLRAAEQERRAPMEALQLENERLRQQMLSKQIGAFRTPEEQAAAAPPELKEFGGRVYELPRKAGEPLQDPLQPTAPLATLPGLRGPIVPSKPIPLPPTRRPLEVQARVTRQRVVQDPSSPSGWSTEMIDQYGRVTDKLMNATPPVGFAPSERESVTRDEFGNVITTRSTTRRNLGGAGGTTPPAKPPLAPPSTAPRPAVNPTVSALADLVEKTGEWSSVPPKGRAAVESELQRRGAVVLNPEQRKSMETLETARNVLKQMDEASSKVHTESDLPFARFGRGGLEKAGQFVFGNPELAAVEAGAAALAPLIRTLGEKGNLANRDIERAEAAAAITTMITRKEAQSRLNTLRSFFDAAEAGIRATAGRTGTQILSGGQFTVTDPRGKVHTFSSQQEADEFKRLAGIK